MHRNLKKPPHNERNPKTPPIQPRSYQKGHKCIPKTAMTTNQLQRLITKNERKTPMPTQQNPTIRQARPTDREALVKMRLSMQEHMEASSSRIWRMTDEGRRSIAKDVEQMLSDEGGRVLVAVEDGAVVGYTHGRVAHRVEYVPSGVGFIHGIYVQEPSRRRGVGTLLVWELAKYFRSQNVDEANLRYVRGNREGEGFWRSLGFEPVIHTANTSLDALESRLRGRSREPKDT